MSRFRVIVCGSGVLADEVIRSLDRLDFEVISVVPFQRKDSVIARIPGVERVACEYSELGSRVPITERTMIVIATRRQNSDEACLRAALGSPAQLVALVGSRSRWAALRETLERRRGVSKKDLDRVCCPAGLDIGSVTPPEIGLSVAAQLVQDRARALFGEAAFKGRRPSRKSIQMLQSIKSASSGKRGGSRS